MKARSKFGIRTNIRSRCQHLIIWVGLKDNHSAMSVKTNGRSRSTGNVHMIFEQRGLYVWYLGSRFGSSRCAHDVLRRMAVTSSNHARLIGRNHIPNQCSHRSEIMCVSGFLQNVAGRSLTFSPFFFVFFSPICSQKSVEIAGIPDNRRRSLKE